MRRVVVVLALLWAVSPARAERKRKNSRLALVLAVGPVALSGGALLLASRWDARPFQDPPPISPNVPYAIAAVAWLVGPSFGGLYAGDVWNPGLATRVVGVGITAAGVGAWAARLDPTIDGVSWAGLLLVIAGSGVQVVGTVIEIALARMTVERGNRQADVQIVPTAAGGPGLSLIGAF